MIIKNRNNIKTLHHGQGVQKMREKYLKKIYNLLFWISLPGEISCDNTISGIHE